MAVAPPMFFHGPVYFHLIQRILDIYGEDRLADGDTLVCNHPYEGNLPHLPDSVGTAARKFYAEPNYTHLETLLIRVLETSYA